MSQPNAQASTSMEALLLELLTPAPLRSRQSPSPFDSLWHNCPGVSIAFRRGGAASIDSSDCSSSNNDFQSRIAGTSNVFDRTAIQCVQFGLQGQNDFPTQPEGLRRQAHSEHISNVQCAVKKETLFQAASISKCILAIGIARLVEIGLIADINDSICKYLDPHVVEGMASNMEARGIVCPADKSTSELAASPAHALLSSISVSDLMAHTAGINVETFFGYASEGCDQDTGAVDLITNSMDAETIVLGTGKTSKLKGSRQPRLPLRSPQIVPEAIPSLVAKYSGGGCMLLQLILGGLASSDPSAKLGLAEDVADTDPFARYMDNVLQSIGMTHSFYTGSQNSHKSEDILALGHYTGTTVVVGGFARYPEQGAIGLWSTPEDLVTGLVNIARGLQSGSGGLNSFATENAPFISTATLRTVLALDQDTTENKSWSRGFRIHSFASEQRERDRNKIMLSHRGCSLGFRCWAGVVVDLEDPDIEPTALAIMTNSEEGDAIRNPLILAFADWFDVPFDAACQLKPIVPLPQVSQFIDTGKTDKIHRDVGGKYSVEGPPFSLPKRMQFCIGTRNYGMEVRLRISFDDQMPGLWFDLLPAAWRGAHDSEWVYRIEGFKSAVMFCVKGGQSCIDAYLIQEDKKLRCRRLSHDLG